MLLSTCCDAPVYNVVDHICSKCKEHCDVYDPELADIISDIMQGVEDEI